MKACDKYAPKLGCLLYLRSGVASYHSARGPRQLSSSPKACFFSASCTAARVDSGVVVPLRGCCMWIAILDAGPGWFRGGALVVLWAAALGDSRLCSLA